MDNKKIFILSGAIILILLVAIMFLGLKFYAEKAKNNLLLKSVENKVPASNKAGKNNFSYKDDKRILSFLGAVKNISNNHLFVEANFSEYVENNKIRKLDIVIGNDTEIVKSLWNEEKGQNEFAKSSLSEIRKDDLLTIYPQDINFLTNEKNVLEAKRIEIEQFHFPEGN